MIQQHLAAWPPRQGTLAVFNGRVMSWTTQDSQVPRIGLQCRRFPPICPKPGQKRHIGESAPWKRLNMVGWQLEVAGNSPVCGPGWEFPLVVAQGMAGKPS